MKILINQTSETYPKDEILSYKVTIIKKDSIRVDLTHYVYDAYIFSGLQEYTQWALNKQKELIAEKDRQIQVLEKTVKKLKESMSISEETINAILTEVIPSIL